MPAFKETSIHSSFFPEAGDNERVERVPTESGQPAKGLKRFLPKRHKSRGTPLRDLREDGEVTTSAAGATPASTRPSTRRSSLTAVGESAAVSIPARSLVCHTRTHVLPCLLSYFVQTTQDAEEKAGPGPAKSNNPAAFGDDKIVLVQFEDGDPENPLNWSKSKKWVTVSP